MNVRNTKVAKLAVTLLGSGIAMGSLMAMAVPTTVQQRGNDTWRDRVEKTYAAFSGDYWGDTMLAEAGPQDLSPVHWEPAPVPLTRIWRDDSQPSAELADAALDLPDDQGADVGDQPAYEPLPAAVLVRRGSDRQVASAQDTDAAAASADAADAAAADVRGAETAAGDAPKLEPAADPAGDPSAT